jgi:hypothetical protein
MRHGPRPQRGMKCAEQRVAQEGLSPSGARMRSAVSKSGVSSRAGRRRGRYGEAYTGTKAKAGHSQGGPEAATCRLRRAGCPPRGGIVLLRTGHNRRLTCRNCRAAAVLSDVVPSWRSTHEPRSARTQHGATRIEKIGSRCGWNRGRRDGRRSIRNSHS